MAETAPDQEKKPEGGAIPFASHIKALKEKILQLTEDRKMGADLLFLNTYMASLAISQCFPPGDLCLCSEPERVHFREVYHQSGPVCQKMELQLFRSFGNSGRKDQE